MKKSNDLEPGDIALMLAFFVMVVWIFVALFRLEPAEGAPLASTETPYITATAPMPLGWTPTCDDRPRMRGCIVTPTATPDGNWINPVPWPTYSPPDDGYPAPPEEPTPNPYPEVQKQTSSANGPVVVDKGLWAWIWDLFTN